MILFRCQERKTPQKKRQRDRAKRRKPNKTGKQKMLQKRIIEHGLMLLRARARLATLHGCTNSVTLLWTSFWLDSISLVVSFVFFSCPIDWNGSFVSVQWHTRTQFRNNCAVDRHSKINCVPDNWTKLIFNQLCELSLVFVFFVCAQNVPCIWFEANSKWAPFCSNQLWLAFSKEKRTTKHTAHMKKKTPLFIWHARLFRNWVNYSMRSQSRTVIQMNPITFFTQNFFPKTFFLHFFFCFDIPLDKKMQTGQYSTIANASFFKARCSLSWI